MIFRAWKKGFRIVEIPIVFVDRTEGASKMSKKIVREASLDGLAPALVGAHREGLMVVRLEGQRFYKMTGSGNDFVVFDASDGSTRDFENESTIRSLSARGTGVGADGVVFVEKAGEGDVRMRYYNSDGSEAALCGNASLCSTRLAVELGLAQAGGFVLHTAAGALKARIRDGLPEVDLEPVREVRPRRQRPGSKTGRGAAWVRVRRSSARRGRDLRCRDCRRHRKGSRAAEPSRFG